MPGTADPVDGPDEVVAFAKEHGVPVAIKAAYGGGGRGLKVARTLEEIPDLYDSDVREAVAVNFFGILQTGIGFILCRLIVCNRL